MACRKPALSRILNWRLPAPDSSVKSKRSGRLLMTLSMAAWISSKNAEEPREHWAFGTPLPSVQEMAPAGGADGSGVGPGSGPEGDDWQPPTATTSATAK